MLRSILGGNTTFAQLVRYAFVATAGLALDFSAVIFTKQVIGLHYLLAAVLGFLLGLIVTYALSNILVFGDPKGSRVKNFMLFGLIGVVGLGILSVLMWLLTGILGVNYIVSKSLATIAVFMWNFFARRRLYTNTE